MKGLVFIFKNGVMCNRICDLTRYCYAFPEYQADIDVAQSPEMLSQHQADSLIINNTIDENENTKGNSKRETKPKDHEEVKDEDADEKNERDHLNYGHLDKTTGESAPRFKHPAKMFKMDMKPAGSSIRLRCAAEGEMSLI